MGKLNPKHIPAPSPLIESPAELARELAPLIVQDPALIPALIALAEAEGIPLATILEVIHELEVDIPALLPVTPAEPVPVPPIVIPVSAAPTIDPLLLCSNVITGTGVPNSLITLHFPDGQTLTTTVEPNGTWSAALPAAITLQHAETITAVQVTPAHQPSPAAAVVVDAGFGHVLTGTVYPIVEEDLGHGPEFLTLFHIRIRLLDSGTCAPLGDLTYALPTGTPGLGRFCLPHAPAGDYVLELQRPGYLTRTLAVHVPAEPGLTVVSPPDADSIELLGGDSNANNIINAADTLYTLAHNNAVYGEANYTADGDINADGVINQADRDIIIANFLLRSSDYSGYGGCAG
jgi:hypothetical protein